MEMWRDGGVRGAGREGGARNSIDWHCDSIDWHKNVGREGGARKCDGIRRGPDEGSLARRPVAGPDGHVVRGSVYWVCVEVEDSQCNFIWQQSVQLHMAALQEQRHYMKEALSTRSGWKWWVKAGE